jgi:hypothetical protein
VASRGSFDRRQFGARRKLGQTTLQKLGRTAVEAAAAEQQEMTLQQRAHAGWRAQASARVEKYAATRDRGPNAESPPSKAKEVKFSTPVDEAKNTRSALGSTPSSEQQRGR